MHISRHPPFNGADSQDHDQLSVVCISKLSREKTCTHVLWTPWHVLQRNVGTSTRTDGATDVLGRDGIPNVL